MIRVIILFQLRHYILTSVADPNPYVFGHSGSGSISTNPIRLRIFLPSSKNSKKNLVSYCFVTFVNDVNGVNVPSKSNEQKNLDSFFVDVLKVKDENNRIRLRILIHGSAEPDPC
jgi:hypothetical protein